MKKHGTVKKIDGDWVIEYRKHMPHAGLSKKGTGPAAGNSRRGPRMFFMDVQLPVHHSSLDLCVEGEEVNYEEEIDWADGLTPKNGKKVFAKIIPYVPKPHTDRLIGFLVGEIIWCRKLKMHTETNLIESIITPEEKIEYDRLHNRWWGGTEYGNLPLDEATNKEDWKIYRTYVRSLHIKYLPHQIEYTNWAYYDIIDIEEFFIGVNRFLWDTDACNYTCTKDDIKIERDVCLNTNLLTIKFTLDYIANPKTYE